MQEQKVKKRGWVKNAVIVFLAIMLVLTFFSNTIMNRSLPEVATTYVASGTITAKIRGSGAIEALEEYELKLGQTRTVETVLVRNGDMVEAGDLLFMLSGEESQELEGAVDALEELQYQYQVALIKASELDYAKDDLDIRYKKEDLARAEAERDELVVSETELIAAENAIRVVEVRINSLNNEIENIKEEIQKLGNTSGNASQLEALRVQIYDKEVEISAAQKALTAAENKNRDNIKLLRQYVINGEKGVLKEYIRSEILATEYKNETYPNENYTHNEWLAFLTAAAAEGYDHDKGKWSSWPYPPNITLELERLNTSIDEQVIDKLKTYNWDDSRIVKYLGEQATILSSSTDESEKRMSSAYLEVKSAEAKLAPLEAELTRLHNQYYQLLSDDDSAAYQALLNRQKEKEKILEAAEQERTTATEKLSELDADKEAWDAANDNIRQLQRDLEGMLMSLASKMKTDDIDQALTNLDMQRLRKNLTDAEEEVAELRSESVDKAVTAPVAGKITSLNVSAGNTTGIDTLLTIELIDRGYQLSFSVTNEQAKKVRIGDMAEVSGYYWGPEITAQLISIKNDPDSPRDKKLLTFNLTGEIESGSQLSLSMGSRGADYEYIVPNSAIRTDNDGDFLLVIEQKQTPLGTRYMAVRVGVNVLEKDDTNSAVSGGGLVSWDYVITSANKPVEPGMYVRLAEGQSR